MRAAGTKTPSYRSARPEDAGALHVLFAEQFVESYGHRYRPADVEAFLATRSLSVWFEALGDPDIAIRIGETAEEVVGYVKIGPVNLPVATEIRPALELHQLYVRTPWHGSGIGASLTRWAIDEARRRGAADLYLAVFPYQIQARDFYGRMGFEPMRTFGFKIGEAEDQDLICRLRLA